MVEKKKISPYSPEFRERAVRMLEEHRSAYPTPAVDLLRKSGEFP